MGQLNYTVIKQLIDLWETFENETGQQSMSDFNEWHSQKLKQNPEKEIASNRKERIEKSESIDLFRNFNEPSQLLEYISRIARLHDFYIRKFFADLDIKNRLEYLFLYTVHLKKSARKTELIYAHLVDYTTGMDTIKRLVNHGLLEETSDEADKRAKLVVITEKGQEVLLQAQKKMTDEIQMFLESIHANKWKKILPFLEEINLFHSDIYLDHGDKTPAELMNLMGSLKHLH